MANYKRKTNKRTVARRMMPDNKVNSWSRHIHLSWLRDKTNKLKELFYN